MTSGRELDSRHLRFALARALVWGPGYGVVRAAAPSYLLLLLLSVVIFGGNSLHPRTILEWVMPRPFAFWLLCLSWVVFSARAYRAAVLDQSWPVLRTLPIGTARLCTALAVAVLLLELPWLALWGFGDGLILLGLMGLLSSGLSLAWLPLPKMRNLRLAQVAFLGAVGWCASQLTPRAVEASGAVSRSAVLASGLTLVALVLVVLTARTAWWRLLERPTGSARAIAMRSPVVALARAYTVSLYRRCGRMLLASTLLYAGAAALSIIMFERSQERLEAQVSFTVAALCCAAVISTAALARSLQNEVQTSRWLISVCAVSDVTRRVAQGSALMLWQGCWIVASIALVAGRTRLEPAIVLELLARSFWLATALAACLSSLVPALHRQRHPARSMLGLTLLAACVGVTLVSIDGQVAGGGVLWGIVLLLTWSGSGLSSAFLCDATRTGFQA